MRAVHSTFKLDEADKLKKEIHGLKLENETLKIQAIERGKKLRGLHHH